MLNHYFNIIYTPKKLRKHLEPNNQQELRPYSPNKN